MQKTSFGRRRNTCFKHRNTFDGTYFLVVRAVKREGLIEPGGTMIVNCNKKMINNDKLTSTIAKQWGRNE